MSQDPYMPPSGYPPPGYPPPGYPYYGAGAGNPARGPARRASNLMIGVGIIGIICGVLMGMAARITPDQLPPAQREQFIQNKQELERTLHTTWDKLATTMSLWSGIPGVILLIIGVLVRGGNRTWIDAGIVVTGALLVLICVGIVRDLVASVRAQAASGYACFLVGAFVVFALQISWLLQARRASGTAATALAADQQAQYWQYVQQQQQTYSQWYGQGQAPPPPPGQAPVTRPPVPPPPSPPPQDQPPGPPENSDQ